MHNSMKNLMLGLVVAGPLGCATTTPPVVSEQQRQTFAEIVRSAEAAGATEGPPRAVSLLADAKSEFEYAQHLPLYPDKARSLVAKAQDDAAQARQLAQEDAKVRAANCAAAREQILAGAPPATPPDAPTAVASPLQ
jgi:hypothetical protein